MAEVIGAKIKAIGMGYVFSAPHKQNDLWPPGNGSSDKGDKGHPDAKDTFSEICCKVNP